MSLTESYRQALQRKGFIDDASQRHAIACLDRLCLALSNPGPLLRLRRRHPLVTDVCRLAAMLPFGCPGKTIRGVYLWGGVGRGKTWLMQLFYQALPFADKQRFHFHEFMQQVHAQLDSQKKRKNPLNHIARTFARQYRLICLDEFIVTNITDAMLLSGLLDALFRYGVTLVVTSNRVPDDLYLNGLQRERFLPAIDLIRQHMHIVHLDNGLDHRQALPESGRMYLWPLSAPNRRQFADRFHRLCATDCEERTTLTLNRRSIAVRARCGDLIWFDFAAICSSPRATADYIEIARRYRTVFIANVPVMDENHDDQARRFIYLIDALYDAGTRLVMLADAPPEALYRGRMVAFAFRRTCSRLIEMRSSRYLATDR